MTKRRGRLRKGTLDVLATACEVRALEYVGTHQALCGFRLMGQPYILENGTASCIHDAVEHSALDVAIAKASHLSRSAPFLLYLESPDACKANVRRQLHALKTVKPLKNCVYSRSKCGCHQGHRIVVSVERHSVGDAYAITVACGHPAHAAKMDRSLRRELKRTVVIPGVAPARPAVIHKEIMRHTLLRRAELIRNDPDVVQGQLDRLDKFAAAVADF